MRHTRSRRSRCILFMLVSVMLSGMCVPAWLMAAELAREKVVNTWATGLDDLTPEERGYLQALADQRLNSAPIKGLFPAPGNHEDLPGCPARKSGGGMAARSERR